ncbi:hypothetical protein ACFVYR_25835 [Streptomyces sp. NPDC058284]|uniref:hypothetical protein n=1 Tax=unclassified Streptomyces TaxID=2593676 RepID=UPI0036474A22
MRQTRWTGAARHAWCRAASAVAFVSLVLTLLLCPGAVALDEGHRIAGHAAATTDAVSLHTGTASVDDADCPPADRHCGPTAHDVQAVLNPAGPSLPTLPKHAPPPRTLPAPGVAVERPSNRGSPDLHMLQVQRI